MTYMEQIDQAAEFIRRACGTAELAVVLGSGLGDYAERLSDVTTVPYAEIPHFPVSTVEGHAGNWHAGTLVWQARVCDAGALPRLRGLCHGGGHHAHPRDGAARRANADPHQRRGRRQHVVPAGLLDADRRRDQPLRQKPPDRPESERIRPALSRYDLRARPAAEKARKERRAELSISRWSTASTAG